MAFGNTKGCGKTRGIPPRVWLKYKLSQTGEGNNTATETMNSTGGVQQSKNT